YRPATERDAVPDEALDVARLVRLASEALRAKEGLRVDATDDAGLGDEEGLRQILSVGTSAGGARAKAVVAWHPERREIRSGQLTDLPDGFEHWLLKFDGVDENRDKEALADPLGYGRIEYAYSRMARDAGIEMTECHLHEEGGRAHFMTRRFDRVGARGRLHYQSLCAMEGYDFNEPRTASYELAFQTMRKLGLGVPDLDQQVRRTVFNVVCRNQDDHTKNIGFLMDREGRWRLSPAFDVTYAYNPSGAWTRAHQMTLGLKSDGFERADVTEPLAKASGLGMADVEAIVDRTVEVASRWSEYADEAGVADPSHRRIDETFRML
ncbi:MAG: HipA domain-containing protein, partial [Planctomycetota bacterium]